MPYKTLRNIIILILVGYFAVGIATQFLDERGQQPYPFFSWFLFYEVPSEERVDYTVLVHEFRGEEISPPLPFEKVEGLYDKSYPTTYYNQLIREMARKLNNGSDTKSLKNQIENHFLDRPVTYEISQIEYNPLERWRNGSIISSSTIHVFSTKN